MAVSKSTALVGVSLQLFGQMRLVRDGRSHLSPLTRKTRAILGYLALATRPASRQRLCEMFFDIPDDPRASLRWSLSKLRPMIDHPGMVRLVSERDAVSLSASDISIDALEIIDLAGRDPTGWTETECRTALDSMQGTLLEDCEMPDRSEYSAWLAAQRQDFHTIAIRLANWLVDSSSGAQKLAHLRRLVALDPLNELASSTLARELVLNGQKDEARKLVSQIERDLASVGLPAGPALRIALNQKPAEPVVVVTQNVQVPHDGRLKIAIMPFHNHSRSEIDDELAVGMLESTIHMLSKFRSLRLASFASVLPHKQIHQTPSTVCADLGVTHLVGGSILVRNGAIRIRYRVLASDGSLESSGDFIHDENGPEALLEDIPAKLVSYLAHHLGDVARKRALDLPVEERSPQDHLAVGIYLGFFAHPLDYEASLRSLEAGLAIDPEYPPLNAYAAWAKGILGQAMTEPEHSNAMAQAHRAMAQADPDAETLAMGAWSAVHIGLDFEPALRTVELATRLNPLSRVAWSASAWVRAMCGEVETPLLHWDNAERCNPLGANIDATHCGRAICCWMAGRYDEAVFWAKRGLDWQPSHPAGHLATVASAIAVGDHDAAMRRSVAMLRHYPTAPEIPAMSSIPIRDPETKQRLLDSIREGVRLVREQQSSGVGPEPLLVQTSIQR